MDNDNSLGIALLDRGNCFTVLDACKEHDVPYGTFALTLINTEYDKIRNAITSTIHSFFNKGFNPEKTEYFVYSLRSRIDLYISYASKGYLHEEQAHMVSELLVREILCRITAEHCEITDIEKCMPVIFSNLQIRNSIMDILKRTSSDFTFLMQETGVSSINSQLINMGAPVYHLHSVTDYLLLDLKMYAERSDKTVKECECCGRLFLPTRKSDRYCRLPSWPGRRKCNEIMHVSPNDVFAKARNKARDKQHKQIMYYDGKKTYEHNFLYNLYDNWSDECGKRYTEYKRIGDIDGFNAWIEETKFTAGRLNEISKQHPE